MTLIIIISILFTIIIISSISIIVLYNKNKKKDTISFKESLELTELPIITFYNGKTKLNFLLDTGSNVSYINNSIISKCNIISKEGYGTSMGIEGTKKETNLCKMNISHNNKEYSELFHIIDLNTPFAAIKKESGVQIHGILGNNFFKKYRYILDFDSLLFYYK